MACSAPSASAYQSEDHFLIRTLAKFHVLCRLVIDPALPNVNVRMFVRTDVVNPCPPDMPGHVPDMIPDIETGVFGRKMGSGRPDIMTGHHHKLLTMNHLSVFLVSLGYPHVRTCNGCARRLFDDGASRVDTYRSSVSCSVLLRVLTGERNSSSSSSNARDNTSRLSDGDAALSTRPIQSFARLIHLFTFPRGLSC